MTSNAGLGLALVAVAAYHLIPAVMTGSIPTTRRSKPLRREERPGEFWVTTSVFAAAASAGAILIAAALLR